MDEIQSANRVLLRGIPVSLPVYSHTGRSIRFYQLQLQTQRLSGTADVLPVLLRESVLSSLPAPGQMAEITGELRSYNNRSGQGRKLVLSVLARSVLPAADGDWENLVELRGTLCKPPSHRMTPLGREICDMMVAVNRPYGRSDYLPCICWGRAARLAGAWEVGQRLSLRGRLQSREYIKALEDRSEKRVAYEVSAAEIRAEG